MFCLALALLPGPAPPPLPEPTPIVRHERHAEGEGPGYFTGRREPPRLGMRAGFGIAGHLAGPVLARTAFDLDVIVGGRISASRRRPGFMVVPELGYNLTAGAHATRSHLLTVGLGLGYRPDRSPTFAFVPRFVAGGMLHERALGLRAGVMAEAGKDGTVGLELAYQALFLPIGAVHTILFTFYTGAFAKIR